MTTVSTLTIVKNEEFFLPIMIASVIDFVDEIIIVDDYSDDNTKKEIDKFNSPKIKYYQLAFGTDMNKARTFALSKCTSDWVFSIDSDEALHETEAAFLKENIELYEKQGVDCLDVEYIHFIYSFKWIDNSVPIHMGISRLFKRYDGIQYVAKYHTLPQYNWKGHGLTISPKLFHLGYLRGMDRLCLKYKQQRENSEIHHPLYLAKWRDWHYMGDYPTKEYVGTLPKVIYKYFMMDVM